MSSVPNLPGESEALPTLPLVIGVTGHRDIPDAARAPLRAAVEDELARLRRQMPNTPLILRSMLAEGADWLAVQAAAGMGIPFEVVLPMAPEEYEKDFQAAPSREQFRGLLAQAQYVHAAPADAEAEVGRSEDYRDCGKRIVGPCHVLLALWDGVANGLTGGTADMVRYKRDMSEDEPNSEWAPLIPGQIVHITTPRANGTGGSEYGVETLYSRGMTAPKWQDFTRMLERYNADIQVRGDDFQEAWRREKDKRRDLVRASQGLLPLLRRYHAADQLAISLKRGVERVNAVYVACCLVLGVTGVVFFKVNPAGQELLFLIPLYGLVFFTALGAYLADRYLQIKRRFVLARSLAEMLRVRFFWTAAGIRAPRPSRAPPSQMDPDEWDALAVSGALPLASPHHAVSLEMVIRDWAEYQRDYYQAKHAQVAAVNTRLNHLARISFVGFLYVPLAVLEVPLSKSLRSLSETGALAFEIAVAMVGIALVAFGTIKSYMILSGLEIQHLDYMTQAEQFQWAAQEAKKLAKIGRLDEIKPLLLQLGNRALVEQSLWAHEQAKGEIMPPR